ncbi:hypothetical protein AXY43_13350 [Clostridium sp. MF28]|uniref:hypothetical protein n=1 Tax=Clostridium TaxID=1485 RepID=UPI000CF8BF4B|nr:MULTISPECIES: hypothetical protein [Clostridium]AVK48930.1 hypothetical protein AXY43_13350 [Clostridium sp. MF28]PSM56507.1 hypothetical protein C4L39_17515 [Clostridium diolis]
MAEKSGFFNSINGDRKYKADFFAEYFSSFISNGVFPNPSTNLQTLSNSDMSITIKAGKAWIKGYYYNNDADLALNIDNADGILNRIDRVVLRFDVITRAINAKVKKGTFATTPAAPELQRDANAYELGIADIYVGKGVLSISQPNITDLRLDNSKCGIVHGTIDQVDTTTLFNQYQTWLTQKKSQYDTDLSTWTTQKKTDFQAWYDSTKSTEQSQIDSMETQFANDFNSWFSGIKNTLNGDIAGNLTNRVDGIQVLQMAQGSSNAIILNGVDLIDGSSKSFRVAYNNNGTSTLVNGRPLYKPNTTTPVNLIKGKAVTIWYDLAGDCFFIKASAEGNTIAAHVLANETFSNDNDTGIIGTMLNQPASVSAVSVGVSTFYPNNRYFRFPPGAYITSTTSGYPEIVATAAQIDSNIISNNIKSGVKIVGVSGSPTVIDSADATAAAGHILNGYSAYTKGVKVAGNIPSKAAATIIPGTTDQTIPANIYTAGPQIIKGDPNLLSQYIVAGKNIFGVDGSATVESLGGSYTSFYRSTTNYQYAAPCVAIDNDGCSYLLVCNSNYSTIDLIKFDAKLNVVTKVSWTRPSDISAPFIRFDRWTNLLWVNIANGGGANSGWYDTNLNFVSWTYRSNRCLAHYPTSYSYVLDDSNGDIYKVSRSSHDAIIQRFDINGNLVYSSTILNVFQSTSGGSLITSIGLSKNYIWIVDSYNNGTTSYTKANKSDGSNVIKVSLNSIYQAGFIGNGTTDYVFKPFRSSTSSSSSYGGYILKESGAQMSIGYAYNAGFSPAGRSVIVLGTSDGSGSSATGTGVTVLDGDVTSIPQSYPFGGLYAESNGFVGAAGNANNEFVMLANAKNLLKFKV